MGQSRRIRDVRGMSVYPKQQTFPDPVGTSRLCQEQSFDLLSARACTEFVRAAFRAHVPSPLGSAACRMAANTRSWFRRPTIRTSLDQAGTGQAVLHRQRNPACFNPSSIWFRAASVPN